MNDVCTRFDQILITDMPASVEGCEDCLRIGGKCYIDQVGLRVNGIHGNTRIPPSPLLQ